MISKITFAISLFVILLGLTAPVQSVRVNITNFQNCDDLDPNQNMEHYVVFSDISIECKDGYCDIVHAKLNIPTVNENDKLLNITIWRCAAQSAGRCAENAEDFYEVLHCERFHRDLSGPWAMISDGMTSASKCGALAGTFEFKNAQLKPEYLTNHMVHDVDFPRYRMRHMLRKVLGNSDTPVLRACIDMEFDVIFN